MITLDPGDDREPVADYAAIMKELRAFDTDLAERPMIVAMSKGDLPEVAEAFKKAKPKFKRKGIDLRLFSAATGEGVRELLIDLYKVVKRGRDGRAADDDDEG
ncbi:hypothetical protein EON77_07200 [bacterium]|nr:MAG: hypothetical protein EON77_07200 [bacterium]